ncbi:MAG TPA: hypothetical protein VGL71_14820 [Urbifossiella sp.]|jgi:hypothetical protein
MRRFLAISLIAVATLGAAFAQPPAGDPPLRFKWQVGQVQTYKVAQQTVIQETTLDEKTEKPVVGEARTTLALTRKWTVKEVDAAGVATLEMQITAVRNEFKKPDGTTELRDSANPEQAREMAEYLNKPVVVVRVDSLGKLVEVKEAKTGSAARLHAEMPFRFVMPEAGPAAGQAWERPFAFKIEPPAGTGESYDFIQKYTCKDVKEGLVTIGVQTVLKSPPKTAGEQVPLVPMLWTGDVYFNSLAGKYHAARLTAKSELANHLGEGSKFVYQSTYSEDAADK